MSDIAIKIDNVYKIYRLGMTGGTTLRAELQSAFAKLLKKEDPNLKIGENTSHYGEIFYALNGVTFDVKKGQALGIIGHNGAGKSTLLKLISRVTGPSEGEILYNGRISSMLEVGTGFHRELTGRENIYLNGTILGMTKSEIDEKFDEIVEFSEVSQFIDTPVKRYSSGMYVKLAFSVASHMNNEIMIMDEVLAVGDMAFQKKCLDKMKDLAKNSGKTILYVSHNMNTIRTLCDRVVVLNKGQVDYDGNTEDAIRRYAKIGDVSESVYYDCSEFKRKFGLGETVRLNSVKILGKEINTFSTGEKINIEMEIEAKEKSVSNCIFYLTTDEDQRIGIMLAENLQLEKGYNKIQAQISTDNIPDGNYYFGINMFRGEKDKSRAKTDEVYKAVSFRILNNTAIALGGDWRYDWYGHVMFDPVKII